MNKLLDVSAYSNSEMVSGSLFLLDSSRSIISRPQIHPLVQVETVLFPKNTFHLLPGRWLPRLVSSLLLCFWPDCVKEHFWPNLHASFVLYLALFSRMGWYLLVLCLRYLHESPLEQQTPFFCRGCDFCHLLCVLTAAPLSFFCIVS